MKKSIVDKAKYKVKWHLVMAVSHNSVMHCLGTFGEGGGGAGLLLTTEMIVTTVNKIKNF